MTATPYRVAIVGCGRKGSTIDDENRWLTNYDSNPCSHASAYTAVDGVRIVAVADPSPDKMSAFQARWGACASYTDYKEMLDRERPDIVSVCTHAPLHSHITIDAANAGAKGILCEKAMATSLEECDAMIDACSKNGTKLLINHPRRFHSTFQQAKNWISETKYLGDLSVIIASGYNKLVHNGSHAFDILRFFAGEAAQVEGDVIVAEDPEDKDGRATLKMQNGTICYVDFASRQPFGFQLWFNEGRVIIDQFTNGYTRIRYVPSDPNATGPWFRYQPKGQEVETVDVASVSPMQQAVKELIASMEQNRESESNGQDGRAALEMALAVHASANRGGEWVALPLKDKELRVCSR